MESPADDLDRRLIIATQGGLPLVARPYDVLAAGLGVSAEEVRARLAAMLASGRIRRIGAVPNHYALGYTANGMSVWDVDDARIVELGEAVGRLDFVTHCYERPRALPDWPYNLFVMVHGRDPGKSPRRPFQFALAETKPFEEVTVEADVNPREQSLLIVFAYQDAAHFNYAHISNDTGVEQPYHNGIFHVYGGERVRISNPAGRASFAGSGRWYHVKLHWSAATGRVRVLVDGQEVPTLNAVDLSLGAGRVGLGSFDETGSFKNVKISGKPKD